MHVLGIPTTRALAAIKTGENVQREQELPGGVMTRVGVITASAPRKPTMF